ncbi:hypothetical protein A2U01_0115268, partial [Trifolium medium]|nr:hypothetical protein [Trifolium medium]
IIALTCPLGFGCDSPEKIPGGTAVAASCWAT